MIQYNGIPNFDAMTPADLWQFWRDCGMSSVLVPRRIARAVFPDRPKGYVRTCKTLAHYACNKAVAMGLRTKGQIDRALVYEHVCDRIYDRLPEYARW